MPSGAERCGATVIGPRLLTSTMELAERSPLSLIIQPTTYLARLEISHASGSEALVWADIEVPLYFDVHGPITDVTVRTIDTIANLKCQPAYSAKHVADEAD
jgi:hypothetical protein